MRVYHNVTSEDTAAWSTMCALYCSNPYVDLCDTNILPSVGNLNTHFTIGRFWRFEALADPSVEMFGSRDVDSCLLLRSGWPLGSGRRGPACRNCQVLSGTV